MEILWFFIGLVLGGIIVWLVFNAHTASTRTALETKLKLKKPNRNFRRLSNLSQPVLCVTITSLFYNWEIRISRHTLLRHKATLT